MKYNRLGQMEIQEQISLSFFSASLVPLPLKHHLLMGHVAFGPKWSLALASQQSWSGVHNYFCVSIQILRVSTPKSD